MIKHAKDLLKKHNKSKKHHPLNKNLLNKNPKATAANQSKP